MTEGQVVTRNIPVVKGQTVRVALAWSSHTSGASNLGKTDILRSDLDLVVRQPNGATTGSFSFDNSYESVGVTASGTGTMRVEVRHDRFDTTSEPYGLAWSLTSPYTDVGPSSFYDDILFIARRGVTTGCGAGRFCPTDPVSRGQMATFLSRALDLPPGGGDFFDDDENSSHESNINRIAAAGITTGCSGDNYCPDGLVRRGHMATFLARALHLPAATRDYFDDDERSEHEDNINRIAAAGITTGCGGNRLLPRRPGHPPADGRIPASRADTLSAERERAPRRRSWRDRQRNLARGGRLDRPRPHHRLGVAKARHEVDHRIARLANVGPRWHRWRPRMGVEDRDEGIAALLELVDDADEVERLDVVPIRARQPIAGGMDAGDVTADRITAEQRA